MSEGQEFLKECKEVRNGFVAIAGQYTVGEHLKLRTEIDTLLIMYDQLCERVRLADSSNENSGLHKHVVNARFSSKDELRTFIQMHIPIAVRPTKPAKTMFVSTFTSANAEKIIIDSLVESFLNVR